MLPPGVAFVAYSDRAKDRFAEVTTPRFYLDLNKYLSSQEQNSTPFTLMLLYLEELMHM